MITNQLRNDIDRLWTDFWTGGIANPLTVIEQISFLMFARLLDIEETRHEKMAARTKASPYKLFGVDQQGLRWKNWSHMGKGEDMLRFVRDEVFPHLRDIGGQGSTFGEYMKDAALFIQRPSLLVSAIEQVERLPLGNSDIKGDLYEYMLGKLTTAGINGQFRTPRHVIQAMVEMIDPKPTDTVGDPACGTAGFLVGTMEYLKRKYSSTNLIEMHADGSRSYPGDLLEPYRMHIQNNMFHGFDFDVTMLRIAAMNMMLHGVENPDIHYMDTLSKQFPEKFPRIAGGANGGLDVVFANPPFKGSLVEEDVHPSILKRVKTKKTELLFLALILQTLKNGGRSATIVPDGVLFGGSKAHLAIRKSLLDDNQLEAIISLPPGVFKPYAGVSTAILIFTKGGTSKEVFFYDVEADGYSLDDKRIPTPESNDLPELVKMFLAWKSRSLELIDRSKKSFCVSADEIRKSRYEFSISKYRKGEARVLAFEDPKGIFLRILAMQERSAGELKALESLL